MAKSNRLHLEQMVQRDRALDAREFQYPGLTFRHLDSPNSFALSAGF